MTHIRPIPPIAAVQEVARNGAQYQHSNEQNMRHAFAVRGEKLPEKESQNDSKFRLEKLKALLAEVEVEHTQIKFELNEDLGKVLVSVVDRETGEVIRQIPGEEAIAIAEHLQALSSQEIQSGALLNLMS